MPSEPEAWLGPVEDDEARMLTRRARAQMVRDAKNGRSILSVDDARAIGDALVGYADDAAAMPDDEESPDAE